MADAWYYAKGPNRLWPVTFEHLRNAAWGVYMVVQGQHPIVAPDGGLR